MAILLAATLSTSPRLALTGDAADPRRQTPPRDSPPCGPTWRTAGNDHFVIYGVAGVTKVGIFRNANGGRFFLYRKTHR